MRRVTSLRALLGDRLAILVGVDDLVLEAVQAGATGWIAGLADALPAESVRLFDLAASGRIAEARALYDWFLPLLRLDTRPEVRAAHQARPAGDGPRLGGRAPAAAAPGAAPEREAVVGLVRYALARRPAAGLS